MDLIGQAMNGALADVIYDAFNRLHWQLPELPAALAKGSGGDRPDQSGRPQRSAAARGLQSPAGGRERCPGGCTGRYDLPVSRAHLNSRYGYGVAVNLDLTLKWAASQRGHLSDGCGVTAKHAISG